MIGSESVGLYSVAPNGRVIIFKYLRFHSLIGLCNGFQGRPLHLDMS